MVTMDIGIPPKKKSTNPFRILFWWQIDEEELVKQVTEYDVLKLYQSARGISAMLLLLSAVVTFLFVLMANGEPTGFIEVAILVLLALFVFLKQRWAMIGAMLFWSLEKIVGMFTGEVSGIFISLLWWAMYMHYFFLALKVENIHREVVKNAQTQPVQPPPPQTPTSSLPPV